ncbi:MAG: pseudouridine-5'-phosphate glycosidase [Pseudomonadota bacterium]
MTNADLLSVSDPVAKALQEGTPVVALESTIVTHGLPFPDNLETARAVETEVRETGAVPATIAIDSGRIRIGLSDGALAELAEAETPRKVSRSDMAATLALGLTGSTTVAATAIAARLAGIDVFATGGIGGVHRGAEDSFDISADLDELAQTSVVVVAAGAKAILDLPKTLEVLETSGVPVIGYRTDDFPAFWAQSSRLPAPIRADSARDIASILRTQRRLGLAAGLLVANPISPDAAIDLAELSASIETALGEAAECGITGKPVTPFLLSRIADLTEGRSIEANKALIRNNARLAAEIACEIASGNPGP